MKNRFVPYDKTLKEFARELRNNSTLSEILLWKKLRARQLKGYQFLRQKPLDRYIADFYCQALNLVIEVDGNSHQSDEALAHDKRRDAILHSYGLNVLRIADIDVKQDMNNVLLRITGYIEDFEEGHF
jgi:very-short-patch-repair endonuclease